MLFHSTEYTRSISKSGCSSFHQQCEVFPGRGWGVMRLNIVYTGRLQPLPFNIPFLTEKEPISHTLMFWILLPENRRQNNIYIYFCFFLR